MPTSSTNLTFRLALALALSTVAVAAVCVVALVVLVDVSDRTRHAVAREVGSLRDATAFDALIYQKGFVANYMLTRDPSWLRKLESARAQFAGWIARQPTWTEGRQRELLDALVREDELYHEERQRAIELFDAGRTQEAIALIPGYHQRIENLRSLARRFGATVRADTERTLRAAERTIGQLAWLLVGVSVVSALANVTVGFLWARRVARPMYQLQLQVESAAERTKVHVAEPASGSQGLAERIVALVDKVEQADAALAEQRRRLIQSEKMSAIGELSAKLGHEILNPLAGMRAAVQLMGLQADAGELSAADVRANQKALENEITRIERLLRRLIGYARPLAPELQPCSLQSVLDTARASVRSQLPEREWHFTYASRREIPELVADPTLLTQVFVNVYRNAAEAMAAGGEIATRVELRTDRGHEQLCVDVEDEGPGFTPTALGSVFTPFRSEKPHGHGLGLAMCRHIVMEHGGSIEAENRRDRTGARVRVCLPVRR